MADGRIVREDIIGSPQEEDLKMWRHSGLGKRILSGDHSTMAHLGLTGTQREALQELLSSIDGGSG
jgi:hypothetical protein